MQERFQNKYRIAPNRLPEWDYSSPGGYFITMCTFRMEDRFGAVKDGIMFLDNAGLIVERSLCDLSRRYPNVSLDAYMIMPNHVHFIVFIYDVETIHESSLQKNGKDRKSDYIKHRRRMLVPRIVGRLKMVTAKAVNRLEKTPGEPVWQKNYYDRVIRDEEELKRIRKYILENPAKWELDRGLPENMKI